jgi:hypothetical protein
MSIKNVKTYIVITTVVLIIMMIWSQTRPIQPDMLADISTQGG